MEATIGEKRKRMRVRKEQENEKEKQNKAREMKEDEKRKAKEDETGNKDSEAETRENIGKQRTADQQKASKTKCHKGKKNGLTEIKGKQSGRQQRKAKKNKEAKEKEKREKNKQTTRENTEQQNNQGKPVRPSAVCIMLSGSAEWLSFNNCVVPQPDGERSLHSMLVAPKRAHHLDSMTPFTRFRRLTITRFRRNLPHTSY
jgi:hypothetical protein